MASNAYLFGQKISVTRWGTGREGRGRREGPSFRNPEWSQSANGASTRNCLCAIPLLFKLDEGEKLGHEPWLRQALA